MRHDYLFFSWLVQCGSADQARDIRQRLEALPLTSLAFSDAARVSADNSEIHPEPSHLVGDFFTSVKILPAQSPSYFQLLFARKPDAPPCWKDAMMDVLRRVRDADSNKETAPVQIVLNYGGDACPPQESTR